MTLCQTVLVFGGTTGAVVLLDHLARRAGIDLVLTRGLGGAEVLAMGLILGLVATANSPSSTVAVINETRSRGPFTTLALGVTVLKDVVVIALMAVTLAVARGLVDPGSRFDETLLFGILTEIAASLALGLALGGLLIVYLSRVNREVALFLLGAIFLTMAATDLLAAAFDLHVHFLLVSMTGGFVVENASARGLALIRGVERSSLPIYVVFFTLSGVGLDLDSLRRMWPLAVGFVLVRGLLVFATTWGGAGMAGEPPTVRRVAWTAFLAQAGISLGLAELVAARYPVMGERIKTLVLAVIALNQLLGPVLFKLGLNRTGEAGRAEDG